MVPALVVLFLLQKPTHGQVTPLADGSTNGICCLVSSTPILNTQTL